MKMYSKTEVKKQGLSITLSILLFEGTMCVKKKFFYGYGQKLVCVRMMS